MRVLYISYNGLTEPLGRRQVLPYVLGLSARGWRFTVLSFEKPETFTEDARSFVADRLAEVGSRWLPLRYHRRPVLPATSWDVAAGVCQGLFRAGNVALVHARSVVPAAMAALLGKLRGVPWIFDVRGLVGREYVDGGHWEADSVRFRLTDGVEQRLLSGADGLVFLTDRIADELRTGGVVRADTPFVVIPCAADLGTFRPDREARQRRREELGLGDDPVLVYSGSLGSWYSLSEMVDFFLVARDEIPKLRLMILTPQEEMAQREVLPRGLGASVLIRRLTPEEVPSHLAAADAGICFLARRPSKAASSPTKHAEYLASGLPVVTDVWTGDAARLLGQPSWIAIEAFSNEEYRRAARALREALSAADDAREAAVSLATAHFSLPQAVTSYDALYRTLLSRVPARSRSPGFPTGSPR